jgi:hypothetical protein
MRLPRLLRRVVFREPAGSLVVGIEADLSFALGALLRAAVGQAMLQTLTSSFSFCASAMTFWATCDGTSS